MLKHKFGAIRTERDGQKFDSKLEARYYDTLKIQQKAGVVLFFLRQTPFHLPGNIKYIADFQVFYSDGNVEFIDCKGVDTPTSKTKRALVEALYPIKIKIITKTKSKHSTHPLPPQQGYHTSNCFSSSNVSATLLHSCIMYHSS